MEVVKTVCHRDYPDTCFIDVTVKDGKVLSTRGSRETPVTQGFLCPRGNGDSKRVYSQKRVLYPFIKSCEQGSKDFLQVSWNDALSKIAEMNDVERYSKIPVSYTDRRTFLKRNYSEPETSN